MKKFVKLLVEHYTEEGLEVKKYDEDAAEGMTAWVESFIDPNYIVRISMCMTQKKDSMLTFTSGDSLCVKGVPSAVMAEIEAQLAMQEA